MEALPDELRQEVISQHFREQRIALQPSAAASTTISPDFLDALPDEIREELLRQERLEADAHRADAATTGRAAEIDPASFLTSLDTQMRQTILMEQDETFLSGLPAMFSAEAQQLRQRLATNATRRQNVADRAATTQNPKPSGAHRETVQLVDKAALMNLVRLIFVPDSTSNTVLYRTLINLSQNSKTRNDLALLLLSILAEGSADLASVDRNFSQMTIRSSKIKSATSTPRKVGVHTSSVDSSGNVAIGETVPNLVAQRCLEALSQLVSFNPHVVDYLLAENDQLASIKLAKTPSKKGRGKDKEKNVHICRYPVIILLRLLERPYFLENSALLEQLMGLLSNVFKALSKIKHAVKSATQEPVSTEAGPSTPAAEGALPDAAVSETAEASNTPKKRVASPANEPKIPLIPVHNIKAVVHVLRDGACSSKTFQFALTVIQNLSRVTEFKEMIATELLASSQHLGEVVSSELKELVSSMAKSTASKELDPKVLLIFSSQSAQQAKLLRLLKAIDFIHMKEHAQALPSKEGAATTSTALPVSESIGTAASTDRKDSLETKVPGSSIIYEQLKFSALWQHLGRILQIINDKNELMHVATVLLPLIESFMVVSKPYVVQKKHTSIPIAPSKQPLSRQASALELTSYDLFVSFTDQHRKILNTMVRNNPSLMGGSFSLLVDNPKILEFDNKRTYFNQQLHKKTARESYGSLQVNVRRQYVFEDSYHQLQGRSGEEIKYSKLNVRFHEEEGVDAGGVTREWYTVLARQMFNPNYALFRPSAADKVTYQPNRASGINPDHLSYFKFVGRVIGKAIYDGRLLDCYFTRSFYKFMLGIEVDYKDMEAIDPEFHKSLEWILNNDITDVLDLTFIYEVDDFGRQKVVELKPGGKNLVVTEENKHEYVKLIVQQRLVVAIKEQITAFLSGFHEVIPKDLIKIFNEQELELLISGLPDIDIDDW